MNGSIKPQHAIYFALFLSFTSIALLYLLVNTLTALLTFLSIIIYSFIYSVYLKNLTSQNIVIGGIAGAMPPLLGWTSITNQIEPFPLVLFLIIFLWTPPHFWPLLSINMRTIKKADIPMLPVTHGRDFARLHIFLYSILLFCITLFPYILELSGFIYLSGSIFIGLKFVIDSYVLMTTKSSRKAIELFRYSITYLALLFAFLLVDHYWYLNIN